MWVSRSLTLRSPWHVRSRRGRTGMAARPAITKSLVVWVTCGAGGTEHAVAEEQMAAGRSGMYVAQCGLRFAAASMVTPARRRCTDCLLQPLPAHHRAVSPRDGLMARWAGRLLRLLRTPVAVSPHPDGGGPASRPDGSHGGVGGRAPWRPDPAVTHHPLLAMEQIEVADLGRGCPAPCVSSSTPPPRSRPLR